VIDDEAHGGSEGVRDRQRPRGSAARRRSPRGRGWGGRPGPDGVPQSASCIVPDAPASDLETSG
jgi:hypothetical protein